MSEVGFLVRRTLFTFRLSRRTIRFKEYTHGHYMFYIKNGLKRSLKKIHLLVLIRFFAKIFHTANVTFIFPIVMRSRVLSRVYYLFSPKFSRENRAMLHGLWRHAKDENGLNRYELVRNIHRIEKGLCMRDRKSVFGLSYLPQTLEIYEKLVQEYRAGKKTMCEHQITWAHDVLEYYFDIAENDPTVKTYKQKFNAVAHPLSQPRDTKLIPYKRKNSFFSKTTYPDFHALALQRRSVRWFLDKPVERALIDKAIEVAELSPSDCNRSPVEFLIFDSPDYVRKIAQIPLGTSGFHANIPVIVVVVGALDAYEFERDRHGIYINTGLKSMSFMYALETLGLASCPLNWPDIEEKERELNHILNLQSFQRPTMLIALGYPDPEGYIPYSAKKCVAEVRTYI